MKKENESDDNLDNYTKKKIEKGIKDLKDEKKLKIKWRKELSENEAVQEYFKGFRESSIKSFVDQYLNQKFLAYTYGDKYFEMNERERSKWILEAHDQLKPILQKQLFDLQCQWRAEQIELEGVEICFDFQVWEHDIFNCPFLRPITKEEIKLYQDFLIDGNPNRNELDFGSWQDYEDIKAGHNQHNQQPVESEWYNFHNFHTGNDSMLLLPDIRGDKEEFYMDLKQQKIREEQKNAPVVTPVDYDARPYLHSHDKPTIEFFINTFEDATSKKNYHNYTVGLIGDEEDEFDCGNLVYEMLGENELIPIEEHYDFRIALEEAYNTYYLKKIAENLNIAHEQYLFNMEMNLTVVQKRDYEQLRNMYLDRILDGREINGESRNLKF